MNTAKPAGSRTAPRLITPTDLGVSATKDIAAALNGLLADTLRALSEDKKLPLARERPAFSRLSSTV